jgi:RNA polymerase sigma factor (sigma-70 family)
VSGVDLPAGVLEMRQQAAAPALPSFEQLLQRFGPMINRIAGSYEADRELARDLVQEILLAVWKASAKFRGDSSLKTFVARIAHNRSITHVARAVKQPPSTELDESLPVDAPHPEAQAITEDTHERLREAVRRLPLAYRQTATLTLEGFDVAEIAEVLGITPNAVSIRLTRARQLLQSLLSELSP